MDRSSVSGAHTAVDVQDLACDERRRLQEEHGVHDVAHLAHPSDRVQGGEELVGLLRVHGGLDGAGRDGVDADATGGVLDGEGLGGGLHTALGQRGQHGRDPGVRVVDQAGGDVDDVAAALGEQVRDGPLGEVEDAGDVDTRHGGVVLGGVLGERLGDEDARVVDHGVDAPEPLHGGLDDAPRGGRVGDVALDGEDVRVVHGCNGARGGDDGVAELAVALDEGGADALRGPGDDRDLLDLRAHGDLLRVGDRY